MEYKYCILKVYIRITLSMKIVFTTNTLFVCIILFILNEGKDSLLVVIKENIHEKEVKSWKTDLV